MKIKSSESIGQQLTTQGNALIVIMLSKYYFENNSSLILNSN